MKPVRLAACSLLVCATLVAAGCAGKPWLMDESTIVPKPIALVESRYINKEPLASVDDSDLAAAAHAYARTGAGPMYVVVAHNQTDSKGHIDKNAAALAKKLEALGVPARDIVTSTVPLTTPEAVALIAFDTLEARKPEGCDAEMPGYTDLPGKPSDFDYKLGCTIKGNIAKQIANPRDLKGVAGLGGASDGENAANDINETTRSATPREFLPNYVISTLAAGG